MFWHGFPTFQFLVGFNSVRIEGVELVNMGQQKLGTYPIHFHRTYDVDGSGDNVAPAYAKQLSIHNSFSRCVTVHSTFGLLVSALQVLCIEQFQECNMVNRVEGDMYNSQSLL